MKKLIKNIHKLWTYMDKPLFFITLILFIFGLLNIVTASSREAVVRYEVSTYYYFFKQLIMLGIGTIGFYILIHLPTKTYKDLILPIYIIVFLLVLLLFKFGIEVNGAKNWLPIPGIGTIQPSELSKPVSIVLFAVFFEQYYRLFQSNNPKRYEKIGIVLILAVLIPLCTFLQKDLGSVIIMVGIFGVLFLAGPMKRSDKFKTIIIACGALSVGLALLYLKQGYILSNAQLSRFNFFNPCSRYETNGYQVCNGFIGMNDGGLFGLGLGKSKQKYSYIPEPHTDSVFAIIAEENGLIRCSFIFLAYIFILYRILKVSVMATTLRGRYICLGVATYLFLHIFINLGGLFGIIPLTGVPLPFLSYGGSYAISLLCSLALVQRIHIEAKNKKIKITS